MPWAAVPSLYGKFKVRDEYSDASRRKTAKADEAIDAFFEQYSAPPSCPKKASD